MIFISVKNKDDLRNLEKLAGIKSNVKQIKLEANLDEKCARYVTKECFERVTKAVTFISENYLWRLNPQQKQVKK